jgi:hypothetical protein
MIANRRSKGWLRAAGVMAARLQQDRRIGERSSDAWGRAAVSMATAWRMRASACGPSTAKAARPLETWTEAARWMKQSLDVRAKQQAEQRSWSAWAKRRSQLGIRYALQPPQPNNGG